LLETSKFFSDFIFDTILIDFNLLFDIFKVCIILKKKKTQLLLQLYK
jgi:hypothetical protein